MKKSQSQKFTPEEKRFLPYLTKKPIEFWLSHSEENLSQTEKFQLEKYLQRYKNDEPFEYIVGSAEFFGYEFSVNKNALIPRPETETLVEIAKDYVISLKKDKLKIIDIGTGSGCIIISLFKQLKEKMSEKSFAGIKFFASDFSEKALAIAMKNAKSNEVASQIKFKQGNLFEPFKNKKWFDSHLVITANLPYLSEKLYHTASKSVRNFEPKMALIAGKDGLDYYRQLLEQVKNFKEKNHASKISLFLEISPEQKPLIEKELLSAFPIEKLDFHKDLFKRWRIAQIEI